MFPPFLTFRNWVQKLNPLRSVINQSNLLNSPEFVGLFRHIFKPVSSTRAGTVIIHLFINYSIPSAHYPCLQNIENLTFNFLLVFLSLISLNSQFSIFFAFLQFYISHFSIKLWFTLFSYPRPKNQIFVWKIMFT